MCHILIIRSSDRRLCWFHLSPQGWQHQLWMGRFCPADLANVCWPANTWVLTSPCGLSCEFLFVSSMSSSLLLSLFSPSSYIGSFQMLCPPGAKAKPCWCRQSSVLPGVFAFLLYLIPWVHINVVVQFHGQKKQWQHFGRQMAKALWA